MAIRKLEVIADDDRRYIKNAVAVVINPYVVALNMQARGHPSAASPDGMTLIKNEHLAGLYEAYNRL